MRRLALLAAALPLFLAFDSPGAQRLDAFADPSGWKPFPAEGVRLETSSDAGSEGPRGALRLDFDFQGHAGWAAVRRNLRLHLPQNFAFRLRLKGETAPQTLEFKLLDASGENVWWSVRRDFAFPRDWTTLSIRRRQIAFAWGPAGGGDLTDVAAVEIAITASSGGRGTVWLDELSIEPMPAEPVGRLVARAVASSELPAFPASAAVDGDPQTSWRSDWREEQQLTLDLGGERELSALVLDWDEADFPRRFDVETSSDGLVWENRREILRDFGGRAFVYLPDADARHVRLRLRASSRGRGYALGEASVEKPEFADTPTKFLENVARLSPAGRWPRSLARQQLYWTLVGEDGGSEKALLSEDGALEIARGGPSIEPFLISSGRLLTWADASISQSLDGGALPIPSVVRTHDNGLRLEITAFADGSALHARYRVVNNSPAAQKARLILAVRPLQVNPPPQFLNVPGGFAAIRRIRSDERSVEIDGRRIEAAFPFRFAAASLASGDIVEKLARGVPGEREGTDPEGFASGALECEVAFSPGEFRDAAITVPLWTGNRPPETAAESGFEGRLSIVRRRWAEKLGRVRLELPAAGAPAAAAVQTSLAWILVERDGPAIQPGARAYARSWIRDGAMMSEALLRLGHAGPVREYLRWYAARVLPGGRVPCCVDRRGADPVPENDSGGELLHLAAEYFRFTGDRDTLEDVWPELTKAAAFLDELRGQRRTADYRTAEKKIFFGLLPESISHEGYSAHPVHSYWDDFWALVGYSDMAWLASELGRTGEARRFAASRDEFRRDLHESIRGVIASRGIDYVPGSADLADLDATSTTIALDPGGEEMGLPRRELTRTFERYWTAFDARRSGASTEEAYTPYEWRIVGTFVRLGWRDRAKALMEYLLSDRRPNAWNQWPEVVGRDYRKPRFIGDVPHGWVASDFIRSTLDLFAWERKEDGAVVLGGGVPSEWLEGGGARLQGLRTPRGTLEVSLRRQGKGVLLKYAGSGAVPSGGYVLRPPLPAGVRRVNIDGRKTPWRGGDVVLHKTRATVTFEP